MPAHLECAAEGGGLGDICSYLTGASKSQRRVNIIGGERQKLKYFFIHFHANPFFFHPNKAADLVSDRFPFPPTLNDEHCVAPI